VTDVVHETDGDVLDDDVRVDVTVAEEERVPDVETEGDAVCVRVGAAVVLADDERMDEAEPWEDFVTLAEPDELFDGNAVRDEEGDKVPVRLTSAVEEGDVVRDVVCVTDADAVIV